MMQSNKRYRSPIREGAVLCLLLLAVLGCGQTGQTRNEASSDPGAASGRQSIAVAAAADLRFAMDDIIAEFRQAHSGIEVQVSYGSSGNFHAQIRNRAPFDIYFSADVAYPRELEREGFIQEGSLFLYAVGQIVVWAPESSALDIENRGIEALGDPGIRHIAIANPQHAPYGQAAEAALRSLGLYEKVQAKLVFGENVAQTLQFVQSGAANVGIVALSLALAPAVRDTGKYWQIPLDAYPRMEQGGAILAHAANPGAAEEFRGFVLSLRGRDILRRYGFFFPGE